MFLNTDLGRNFFGDTQIFNKSFNEANLSEGQRVLLQLCVGLNENEISLQDAILIMDEPENHLHPRILINVLEKILEINTNGQIWIATHSIPLIAHFDPAYLWLMDDNTVQYAGRNPEKVINNLVGDDEKEKLTNFLNLPAAFASTKFASECLIPPQIINTGINDPQTNQIRTILQKLSNSEKLTVLDYGAGKGRLIKLILQFRDINPDESKAYLDYFAYDLPTVDPEIKEECIKAINLFHNEDKRLIKQRYFNDKQQMFFDNTEFFDVIVMANVFHEIDPTQWMKLFSKEDLIIKLKSNGYLLIVEDQQMPVGEKAYKNGFMVFGEAQFRLLFNIKAGDGYSVYDSKKDGRLLAHLIPKTNLKTLSTDSICEAIKSLKSASLDKIHELRNSGETDFKTGMKLSFWLHQYANSSLNLQPFKNDF